MQYFDFNFEIDKNFLNNSKVFNKIVKKIEKDKNLMHCEPIFKSACIKLWGESVLKHNLNGSMGKVEHLNLITKENSKEVIKNIGKIIFKTRQNKTSEDYKKLREQSLISISIDLIVMLELDKKDICNELKTEFLDFKSTFVNTVGSKRLKV